MKRSRGAAVRGLSRASLLFFLALVALNAAAWIWTDSRRGEVRAGERVPPLSVRHLLPGVGLERADRLTVMLDAPLVADGEPLPRIEGAPYALDPAMRGVWRVAARDRIEFILQEPIERGDVVIARPTEALERLAGRRCDQDRALVWRSAPIAVSRVSVLEHGPEGGTARLRLNGPLAADAIRSRLCAEGGEVLQVLGEGDLDEFEVRFRFDGAADGEIAFAIAEDPANVERLRGVEALVAGYPGAEPVSVTRFVTGVVPRGFTVVDTDASPHAARRGGEVVLEFSDVLEPGQEGLSVTVDPPVEGLGHRIRRDELVLEGGFVAGETYTITVPEDVLSLGGETPRAPFAVAVDMPVRRARVALRGDGGVLSPDGELEVELVSTAVRSVRVTVREVLPGNVVSHVRGDDRDFTSRNEFSEVFELTAPADGEPIARHALDLRGLLARTPGGVLGIHAVEVKAVGHRWIRDDATIRVTDLGLTTKRDAGGVHVWAASIATGEVVVGAEVALMTVTDQALGGGVTDVEGHAFIALGPELDGAEPFLVLARSGDDASYQRLTGQRWRVPREVAAGRTAPDGTDVLLYPERNLYRPGDPVHLTGIARTARGLVDAGARLALEVERPDGRVVHRAEVSSEPDQAVFHATFETSADARTGTWRARVVDLATDETAGEARFSVEAFLPARLVVSPDAPGSGAPMSGEGHGDRGSPDRWASVHVRALSASSVEGFRAKAEIEWTPATFDADAYPAFSFAAAPWEPSGKRRTRHTTSEAPLDAEGSATVTFEPPPDLPAGLWRARATWAVTEPGGRTATARSAPRSIDTADQHVGVRVALDGALPFDAPLSAADHVAVRRGAPFDVSVVALDPGGGPAPLERVTAILESVSAHHTLRARGGELRWERVESTRVLWSGPVVLEGGRGRVAVETNEYGRHRLTLRGEGLHAPVGVELWATDDDPELFEPPLEGDALVEVRPAANRARPGESVEVEIEAPFDGSVLVMLEDERLRWHARVDVEDGVATVTVPIPADARGGVALSCQLTRPVTRGLAEWRPHRAYGWARIDTDHTDARIDVAIEAPARVRPGAAVSVAVAASSEAPLPAGARVHLWAVDEGIRVVGRHSVPDPHEHFLGPRARGASTTDMWFDLMEDLALPETLARIGGDADLAEAARHLAPERVHTEPGVVWLESVPLDGDGVARFDVEVPDFTGELTWMATVAAGERFGATSSATTLASDVLLRASVPRFLAPGDEVLVPVRIENTSEVGAEVTLSLRIDAGARLDDGAVAGPVEASAADDGVALVGLDERATLAPGERRIAWLPMRVADGGGRVLGAIALTGILADGRDVAELCEIDVPLRTGRPRATASRVLSLRAAGAPDALDIAALCGLDDLAGASVHVSADPGVGLLPLGRYLDRYPYGCAEQTASRVIAYLAVPDLLSGADDAAVARDEIAARVEFGLARLANMQRSGGGIAYWPSAEEPRLWVSVWVAEALSDAASRGHALREGLLADLAAHLGREIDRGGQSRRARVLIAVALARLGRAPLGWLSRLEEQAPRMPARERSALAAALAIAGEGERALAVLDLGDGGEADTAATSRWRLDALLSDARADALRLEAMLLAAPDATRTPEAARALERRASAARGPLANTIDSAAVLRALSRYRAAVTAEPAEWTARVGDRAFDAGAGTVSIEVEDPAAPLPFSLEGTGPAFVTVIAEGRAAADAAARSDGLEVARRIADANDHLVDPADLELGDLVFVDLFVRAVETPVPDCVVVDPLPGGLEIENPRLGDGAAPSLPAREPAPAGGGLPLHIAPRAPERVEFLDDRVLVFDSIGTEWQRYRYPARAVAVGRFEHAPAMAESMYDRGIAATSGASGAVEVAR